jgi:predicted GH43/DUF377 family glycosyl hydrolase
MLFFPAASFSSVDLEEMAQDFVLETKKIEIPGYPDAFNPSIIRWEGRYLMSFRVIPDPKFSFQSWIGLIFLDDDFHPVGPPQPLDMRQGCQTPCRAEDARLILIGDQLWMVYSDNREKKISRGGFRVYIAKVANDGDLFFLENIECLSCFEGEDRNVREKNWVPFDYQGNLLLAYSLQPHKILCPIVGTGECESVACSRSEIQWDWGVLRGGTPALLDSSGDYLAFFHSTKDMESLHSQGKIVSHYFFGAYTFSRHPPFAITRISPDPIVGKGFYEGRDYKPYWKPVRVVFPCGFVMNDDFIWIAYGRQDHEIWIVKLDKNGLLNNLKPVR